MEKLILKARHWQVFVIFLCIYVIINLQVVNDPMLSNIINAVGLSIYLIWFAFMGNILSPLRPRSIQHSLTWFLIDIILSAAALAALVILTDDRSYHAEGWESLIMLYIFFALLHGPWFLARTLVALERGYDPEFGFYFGTILLFIFWPIGIWFVQPRLNKIWENNSTQF